MRRVSSGWSESMTTVVPVLSEQRDPPARYEDPAGFVQGRIRIGQDVVHLVRPVPVRLPVAKRQLGGAGGAHVDAGKPAAGGGQHVRVEVHADGVGPRARPVRPRRGRAPQPMSTTVASGGQPQELVAARAQPRGGGQGFRGVELPDQRVGGGVGGVRVGHAPEYETSGLPEVNPACY